MTPRLVSELMSRDVKTLELNDTLAIADRVMTLERIRHLPVLDDDGAVVGVVSQRDMFRGALARTLGYGSHAQQKLLDALLVKEVMSSSVVTTAPDRPLSEAARVMVERKVGCLPVVENDKLVGILTEADFVALYLKGA